MSAESGAIPASSAFQGEQTDSYAHRFGRFELNLRRGTLSSGGEGIPLRPKSFALLAFFVERPGRLISKEELLRKLWPGLVVSEDSLVQCVGEIRAALGSTGQNVIRTIPRRGYIFEASVERLDTSDTTPADAQTDWSGAASQSRVTTGRGRWALLIAAAIALGVALVWHLRPSFEKVDQAITAQRAIAVLPFVDLSDSPSPALAEAVAEDVSMAIAYLDDTLVFANTSTAAFVGKKADSRAAAQALGATHVLTGSVQRNADGLLVRAQLHDVNSGAVIWSDRFEYGVADRQRLQQDMVQRIANILDARMRDAHFPTSDVADGNRDATRATEQGIYLVRHTKSREDLLRARALFEAALAADSTSTVALTYWGMTQVTEVLRRWSTDRERKIGMASEAFEQAIRRRPDYALAYFGRSLVASARGQVDVAARACEDALARWPNEPRCLMRLGLARLMQGRPAELIAPVELALRLNPLEYGQVGWGHFYLGMAQFHLRHDDEAYEEMRRASTIDPENGFTWEWMAAIDALHGRQAQAQANLAKYRLLIPGYTVSSLRATEPVKNVDFWSQRSRFFEGLRMAGLPNE